MQTWLVHMRKPVELYRSLGQGFWLSSSSSAATFHRAVAALHVVIFCSGWPPTGRLRHHFPAVGTLIGLFNLIIGNLFFVYFDVLGAFKRRYYDLVPSALLPVYWVLMTIAAYKASGS